MKRKHRPDLLYAFALSLVFVVIDAAVFALTAEPLGSVLRFTPVWLCNVVHAAAIALIGTLLGCCSMLALNRRKNIWLLGAIPFLPFIWCYATGLQSLAYQRKADRQHWN